MVYHFIDVITKAVLLSQEIGEDRHLTPAEGDTYELNEFPYTVNFLVKVPQQLAIKVMVSAITKKRVAEPIPAKKRDYV
jgi:hypothetical protein